MHYIHEFSSPAAHVETEDAGEKVAKMEIRPTNYRRNPKFHLFKQHVVVRNDQDGFYYPGILPNDCRFTVSRKLGYVTFVSLHLFLYLGIILEGMANEFLTVRLSIGNIKSVPLGEIIFTGGANSCPVLKVITVINNISVL